MMPNGASTPVTNDNREDYVNALCDYRLREAVRVQFDRFAKGFWRVLGQSSIERVVEAEELRVMVQGDEAPLDWAALQDVCAYEGFGEAVGGADDAATPPVNDDMSADVEEVLANCEKGDRKIKDCLGDVKESGEAVVAVVEEAFEAYKACKSE